MKQFIHTRGKFNDIWNNGNILPNNHLLEAKNSLSQIHLNNNNESEIAYDSQQMILTKCPRLIYHKIKQFMRTRSRCNEISNNDFKTTRHAHDGTMKIAYKKASSNKKTRMTFLGLKQILHNIGNKKKTTIRKQIHPRKKDEKYIYMKQVQDMPRNTCAVCTRLHFVKNITCFTRELHEKHMNLALNNMTFSNENICVACKKELQNGKLPQFATPEKIRCNIPLPTENTLLDLEERLVSLRIAFAKIRQWGYKQSQIGLTGSIINVPVHMDVVQKALPQYLSDTMTIANALKR